MMKALVLKAIEMMARFGNGIPANMIPFAIHDVGRAGHDILVGAIALGYHQVFILANPQKTDEAGPLAVQIDLARSLLAGVNADAEGRLTLINEADPDVIGNILWPRQAARAIPKPHHLVRLAHRGECCGWRCVGLAPPTNQAWMLFHCRKAPPMAG